MAPDNSAEENIEYLDDDRQYLFIIRHGDRWDYATPEVRFVSDLGRYVLP
jgi:hypothetical protein